jgi:ferredoxin
LTVENYTINQFREKPRMTHIITSLCLRDSACVDVCPVECIVGGKPEAEWPWYYIDPDTCIDCGACIPECPYEAIFIEDEVPKAYIAKGDEVQSMPVGAAGFGEAHTEKTKKGEVINLTATRKLSAGQSVDLTPDIKPNYDFFSSGPGYSA